MVKEHEWGSDPEFVGPLHFYRERLMMRSIRRLHKGGRVLDAGMGGGSLILKVAKLGGEVYGIDRSRLFVAIVQRKAREAGLENVRVRQGVLSKLPYPDAFFDMIVCGEVIEHIEDVPAVKEFARVLTPHGVLVLTTPNDPKQWSITDEWAGHMRRYTRASMERLLHKSFKIHAFRYIGFPLVRIYQVLIFRRLVGKKAKDPQRTRPSLLKNLLSFTLSLIFHFDEIFSWHPGGVGMLVVAKKK